MSQNNFRFSVLKIVSLTIVATALVGVGKVSQASLNNNTNTPPQPIYKVAGSNQTSSQQAYTQGEIIVKLKSAAQSGLSAANGQTGSAVSINAVIQAHGGISAKPILNRGLAQATSALSTKTLNAQQSAAIAAAQDRLNNIYLVNIASNADPIKTCKEFKKDSQVDYCQPNYRIKANMVPNDPYFSSSGTWGQSYDDLWGLKKMQADKAWDSVQGQGIIVAVVDTGVDYTHPDIAANMWTNPKENAGNGVDDDHNGFIDDVRGWSFAYNNNDPIDRFGHGTHVAGIIAAIGNNNAGIIGVAPKAKIMPVKALDDDGYGNSSVLAEGIVYAVQNGANVINNSWGCSIACPSDPITEDAVRYAYANNVIVVFAAGNSSTDVAYFSPQNMTDSRPIIVAASDQTDTATYFSDFGNLVDVSAPGGGKHDEPGITKSVYNILSLKSATMSSEITSDAIVNSNYLRLAGTSMATPQVSGIMALLKQQFPTASLDTLKRILMGNTDPVKPYAAGASYGYGRVNIAKAILDSQDYVLARIFSPGDYAAFTSGQQVILTGEASAKNFSRYEVQVGQGDAPTTWQSNGIIMPGKETLSGTLATWTIPSTAALGAWTLRLVVYDTTGHSKEARLHISVQKPERAGWPKTLPGYYNFSSVVADIDNDGKQEILITGAEGYGTSILYAFHSDGSLVDGFPVRGSGGSFYRPVVADFGLDPSGKQIAVINGRGALYLYNKKGQLLSGWPQFYNIRYSFELTPIVADLFGNGKKQIIVPATQTGLYTTLYAYNADGTQVAGWPLNLQYYIYDTFVAAADIDGDGKDEIIVADKGGSSLEFGNLYAFRGNGTLVSGFPVALGGMSNMIPVVGDIDGDGKPEILVYSGNNKLYAFDGTGHIKPGWPVSPDLPIYSAVLADMDGDGKLDVVAASADYATNSDHRVTVYKGDGTILPPWPKSIKAIFPDMIQIIDMKAGNITGDQQRNISLLCARPEPASDNFVISTISLDAQGNLLAPFPLQLGTDFLASAITLADLNYSGALSLVTANNIGDAYDYAGFNLHVWDMPGSYNPRLLDWPQDGQNTRHTSFLKLPKNTPPVLAAIPSQRVALGDTLTLQLQGSDPDGNQIVYSGSNLPQGATINAGLLTDVNHDGIVNDADVQLVSGKIGTATAAYDVNNDGIVDQRDVTLVKADLNKTATSPGIFSWTPGLNLSIGTTTVTAEVSDGISKTSTPLQIETYKKNSPPVMDPINNVTAPVGQLLAVKVTANDADLDPMTFTSSALPAGAVFLPLGDVTMNGVLNSLDVQQTQQYVVKLKADFTPTQLKLADFNQNGIINSLDVQQMQQVVVKLKPLTTYLMLWTPTAGQIGNYPITFTVTDGRSAPVSQSIVITVK